jgi:hypothetical protein
VELARFLIEHGADAAAWDEDGFTPLHLASLRGHVELAWFLVEEHGADVAARAKDRQTPLHSASKGGHVELARFLIEHGADAAARAEDGWTPLHSASLTLLMDNQSAIAIAKNPAFHERTKHIEVRYHFLKMMVEDGKIKLEYVPTTEQTADAMTKGLAREKHELFVGQMGLCRLG